MTPLIRFALGFMLVFTSLFLIALVLISEQSSRRERTSSTDALRRNVKEWGIS